MDMLYQESPMEMKPRLPGVLTLAVLVGRTTLLVVSAFALGSLAAAVGAAAQGHPDRGCHTCFDYWAGPGIEDWEHYFVLDGCEDINLADGAQALAHPEHSSLCGFTSDCHEEPKENVCHITCDDHCNPHVDPECDVNQFVWGRDQLSAERFLAHLEEELNGWRNVEFSEEGSEIRVRALAEAVRGVDALSFHESTESLRFEGCGGRVLGLWELDNPLLDRLRHAITSDD
jgi:hypothetical protein